MWSKAKILLRKGCFDSKSLSNTYILTFFSAVCDFGQFCKVIIVRLIWFNFFPYFNDFCIWYAKIKNNIAIFTNSKSKIRNINFCVSVRWSTNEVIIKINVIYQTCISITNVALRIWCVQLSVLVIPDLFAPFQMVPKSWIQYFKLTRNRCLVFSKVRSYDFVHIY